MLRAHRWGCVVLLSYNQGRLKIMYIPSCLALVLNLFYVLFICEFSSSHIAVHVGIFVCFVTDFIALKAGVLMNCL